MNTTMDENLTISMANLLENNYLSNHTNSDTTNYFDSFKSIEEKTLVAIEKYIKITNPEIKGATLDQLKETLHQDFLEYYKNHKSEINQIDTLEALTRIAFFRLSKASTNCYTEKIINSNSEKLNAFEKIAKKLKKEYELFSIIN